ncbi:hydrolase-like protein [Podospora appendiculata]|uniref:Hydrolase-like protein n=1 Tax=Podospora appendiculata TaxID=314037 RepID=A0AAE1CI85_9PEZI|nr:hydrolase-like protein [Podospora appendiculata]
MASAPEDVTPPPPSFAGRIKLQDFMFDTAGAAAGPAVLRRSPRHSTPTSTNTDITITNTNTNTKAPPAHQQGTSTSTTTRSPSSKRKAPPTTSPTKRKKTSPSTLSSYAPPSHYAHLPLLPDAIGPNLLVLFIGLNPGIQTARTGHAYAHPTNHFWRLLHSSGITPYLVSPADDGQMPRRYGLGLTNIVARPSRNGAELSKAEMDAGVAVLQAKVRRWRPAAVCVVGKSIWESLWRVRHGRGLRRDEFRYGWQEEGENMGVGDGGDGDEEREDGVDYSGEWKGARVFVATSTSGLAATLKPQEKQAIWRELGVWVEQRREEEKKKKKVAAAVVVEEDGVGEGSGIGNE